MTEVPWVVLAWACGASVSWLALRAEASHRGPLAVIESLGLGWGVACTSLSLLVFLLISVGATERTGWWMVALGVAGLCLAWLVGRSSNGEARSATARAGAPSRAPGARRLDALAWAVFGCTVLLLVWAAVSWFTFLPYGSADAVNIWGSRALFLSRGGDDAEAAFELLRRGHPDYPLLLPGVVAGLYLASGTESLLIPQSVGCAFLVALGLLFYREGRRTAPQWAALFGLSLVLSTPIVSRWAFSQTADTATAYYLFGSVATLAPLVTRRAPPSAARVVVAGLFVGGLMWVKNEGTVVGIGLLTLFLLLVIFRRRHLAKPWQRLLGLGIACAPTWLALLTFKTAWLPDPAPRGFLDGVFGNLTDFDRWKLVIGGWWDQLASWNGVRLWGLSWLVVAGLAIPARRSRGDRLWGEILLWGGVAGALAAYSLAFLLSPYDLAWHTSRSMHRLLLQVFPTVALGCLVGLSNRLWGERSSAAPPS